MDRGSWRKPVVLEAYGTAEKIIVSDTFDAALILLGHWPGRGREAHDLAARTCRDVLIGRAVPSLARVDFIEAALEAGLLVRPETFLSESAFLPDIGSPSLQVGVKPPGLMERDAFLASLTDRREALSGIRSRVQWETPAKTMAEPPERMRDLFAHLREDIRRILQEFLRITANAFSLPGWRRQYPFR